MSGGLPLAVPPIVADAWRWWLTELTGMAPSRFNTHTAKTPHATIVIEPGSVAVERTEAGTGERLVDARAIEQLDDEAWNQLAILIATTRSEVRLTPPDVYVTTISLPKAARGRLRAAVELQLEHIAPLAPERLRWNASIVAIGPEHLTIAVAMAKADRVEALQTLLETRGITPPPVVAVHDNQTIVLADGVDASHTDERRLDRRAWTIAIALILSIPFTTLAAASAMLASTDAKIVAGEAQIRPRLERERNWKRDESLRQALRPLLARPTASETIELLASVLPITASAQAIEQEPSRTLLLTLDTSNGDALDAELGNYPQLHGVTLADQTLASDGRMRRTYRAGPR